VGERGELFLVELRSRGGERGRGGEQLPAGSQGPGGGLGAGDLHDLVFLGEQDGGGVPRAVGGGDRDQVGAGQESVEEGAGLVGVEQAGGGMVGVLGDLRSVEGGVVAGEPVGGQ